MKPLAKQAKAQLWAGVLVALTVVGTYWLARRFHLVPYRRPDLHRLQAQARDYWGARGVQYPLEEPSIVVVKRRRILTLLAQGKVIAEFPVVLGRQPEGPKLREGDGKTPEGNYYVCEKHYSRRFYLFMGLSYPSLQDAEEGRKQGRIGEHEYVAIARAQTLRACPPWHTGLGGAIGIHGGGLGGDWTLGYIALRDRDIELLYASVPVGTAVRITP